MQHSQQLSAEKKWLLVAMLMAAFWPVWRWLIARAFDNSGDAWELVSLGTALVYIAIARVRVSDEDASLPNPLMWPTMLLLLTYAVLFFLLPPLLRSILAAMTLATFCSAFWLSKRLDLPLCCLLLLSLPLIESLNFYLGYPLRVAVGSVTAALLNMDGFSVVREGAVLNWGGRLIAIDAPCSGIKMLWAGLYLSCTLSAFGQLGTLRTLMLGVVAVIAVFVANVLRATALFFVEANIVNVAKEWHDYIGVAVFLGAALGVASVARRLKAHGYAN